MAETIYVLCAATCLLCFLMLLRSYRKTRVRLLFWSANAFLLFTVTNILLVVDMAMLPSVDLELHRSAVTLIAVGLLVYGLIWET